MVTSGLSTLSATLVLAVMMVAPASATTVFPEQFTCPIGGEVFEDYVIGSFSSFGQRPDGRAYGTLPVYPLVECPGNGFLLFEKEFTAEEAALLTPAVGSAEYQAMRQSETSYYRAWWLMRALGRPPEALASALLAASWESDDDAPRKARYQRAFVEAADQISPTAEDWFYYNLRAANALRELARFEDAEHRLRVLEASDAWPADPDERGGARFLFDGLRLLVAESNSHAEPDQPDPTHGGSQTVHRRRCRALPGRADCLR